MIVHTKMPCEVPNDVIMYHEKRIECNILISAWMPYYTNSTTKCFIFFHFLTNADAGSLYFLQLKGLKQRYEKE